MSILCLCILICLDLVGVTGRNNVYKTRIPGPLPGVQTNYQVASLDGSFQVLCYVPVQQIVSFLKRATVYANIYINTEGPLLNITPEARFEREIWRLCE